VDPRDVLAEQLFDGLDRLEIVWRYQRRREALAPRPPSASDTVHIIFGMDRYVVIEDVAYFRNIETTRRYVACRQEVDGAGAEGIERCRTLVLVHVPVQRADIEAMALQRAIENADVLLAVAEDDGVLDVDLPHQCPKRFALTGGIAGGLFQPFHDGRRRGRLRSNLYAFRTVQEFVGKALDFGRHGRREEQRLASEGEESADALDIGNEAHVEHAVGFVDHHDLDAIEQELAALEMIEEAAGRRDYYVGAAIELAVLVLVGHAADQEGHG